MTTKLNRKEAAQEYKLRKVPRGIFLVRCAATGEKWVGSSPNLDGANNALWFQLRGRLHREKALQDAWNEHGETAFEFEILETLDEDLIPLAVNDLLKEKKALWSEQLAAQTLF